MKFSLEFYPPIKSEKDAGLMEVIDKYVKLEPEYLTITHGSGGADRTKQRVLELHDKYPDLPVAAHVTATGRTKAEVLESTENFWQKGIKKLIVLRGDSKDGSAFVAHPEGFRYGLEMVEAIKNQHEDFDVIVAAYAEGHPEAPSLSFDLDYLKRKFDAGASCAITQFFFDPELYLRFRDRAVKVGIEKPIIPGILPLLNFEKMCGYAKKCGAPVPNFLHDLFDGLEPSEENHKIFAMNILSHQITRLNYEGVDHIHFYTLNETFLTYHVCRWLKIGV